MEGLLQREQFLVQNSCNLQQQNKLPHCQHLVHWRALAGSVQISHRSGGFVKAKLRNSCLFCSLGCEMPTEEDQSETKLYKSCFPAGCMPPSPQPPPWHTSSTHNRHILQDDIKPAYFFQIMINYLKIPAQSSAEWKPWSAGTTLWKRNPLTNTKIEKHKFKNVKDKYTNTCRRDPCWNISIPGIERATDRLQMIRIRGYSE